MSVSQYDRQAALLHARRMGLPNIMIIGPMGAGKTTGAQFLADEFGYTRLPIAGAHPGGIRDIAARLWGFDATNDREKLNGLAVIDDQFPGVWFQAWERFVEDVKPAPIVVDDVRRELEYDGLRARGFVCVRVVAGEQDRVDRLKVSGKWQNEEQLHGRWEQWWPTAKVEHEIVNDGTWSEYYDELIRVIYRERKRR